MIIFINYFAHSYIIAYKDNKLNYKLKCPYELLYEQLVFMKNKLRILSERAKIEGIELIMDLKRG